MIMKTLITTLFAAGILTWSSHALCGEIQDAVQAGDLEKVKALLKSVPDLVSNRNDTGQTPLIVAAMNGRKDAAEVLLADKADVGARDNAGQTALHWAVSSRQKDIAILLLANKADVNAKSNSSQTPLHYAAAFCFGDTNMVDLLLVNQADVNAKDSGGKTPLHMAALYGFKDIAALLIASKADVNAKDSNGKTPLAAALDTNSVPIYMAVTAAPGKKQVADLLRQHGGQE
jgi:ankyrin repeat protein